MLRHESSDLFRWLVEQRLIGDDLRDRIFPEELDEICSLIEDRSKQWDDALRDYKVSCPVPGIGTNPTLQG